MPSCFSKIASYLGLMWKTPSLQVVREDRRGRLIFPPDLPKERGCKTQIFASLTMVVSLLGSCYLHYVLAAPSNVWESFRYVGISFSSCFVVFILGHFFIRLWKMFEEFFHLRARYEGSIMQILKETFHCNTITYICSGCALFLMPWFWHVYGNFYKYIFKYESPLLCVLCTAFCFSHVIKMEESPLNRTLQLVQLGGLDYGSGMAYSFFYGYLQFILPNKGDSNKGLKEKIQDYVSHHKLNESLFPVKKLFILIPSSGYIATCLTKMDSKMCLEEATSLDAEKRNVAGVQARSYKNSIYKIRSPDNTELVYLAVEGATPVKTYYNVMRQDPQKGELFKKYQKEISLRFFQTLVDIIKNDKDCCDLCEIVYYKDSDQNGQPLDLSDILKTKLQEIKERRQPAVNERVHVSINVTETQPESVQLLESPTQHA